MNRIQLSLSKKKTILRSEIFKPMKPSENYLSLLEECDFKVDPAQQATINRLDRLYELLVEAIPEASKWWERVFQISNKREPIRSLYLWGGVGRGKTFLMDIFFQSLPLKNKQRFHFHQFMNQIHVELKQKKDLENPLQIIAKTLSDDMRVLCLDEFVINDIGDAMIMAGLIESLFEFGVVLVTTSNSPPENLYHDGLQRARFLPAIAIIKSHCDVINLDGGEDYRLSGLQQTRLYNVPHADSVVDEIEQYLIHHVRPVQNEIKELTVNGRKMEFEYCAEDTIWFNFEFLCNTNRSQQDYLELARLFNTIIVTDIRQMQSQSDDIAKRFVLLIDILYDNQVILICSAAVSPVELYLGKRLAFEFERTASRLIEMQSEEYLARQQMEIAPND